MELIIDSYRKLEVSNLFYDGEELHIITEKDSDLLINGILVLQMKNDTEILCMIKDIKESTEHKMLSCEINPNQKENFQIKELAEILLWGQAQN